jgi:colanic acid/amylovoran biosynthesis glycosyltransferase
MKPQRKVVIFRRNYLPVSETFVSDHIRHLRAFAPLVVCEHEMPAAHRTPHQPLVIGEGRLSRWLFTRWGLSSRFDALLRDHQPDLVHAHFLTDAAALLPFMERNKLPFVVTAHGYDAATYDEHLGAFEDGRWLLARRNRLIRRVDKVICVSEFIRQELLKRGFPAEKLVVCHLGIELDAFPVAAADANARRGVFSVGRLVEKKGMHLLVQAYAALPEPLRAQHPLRIIGDGPLRGALQDLAGQLNVDVQFLGSQPRTEVLRELGSAAVFCLASRRAANGDAEGMPIAIMESLASGSPTCIFDDQPMAPILRAAGAGLLPEAGNVQALADSLERALTDAGERERLAVVGRQVVEQHFDLGRNVAALEGHYESVARS